ncbi:uncharacterized protein LOC133188243 [Saccostrea echinata]|uniref:uncharacterized protein LOC133188243 n=1 Tax=Saccostrea echinata TaxID=191078 RepID=UPI002A809559|nr:uncharacterized protein LOC133188243 [Saccostrea echinata]
MIGLLSFLLLLLHTADGESKAGTCKDMLQGYLTEQLSSALEIESLKQEFKRFTDVIDKSVNTLKGQVEASLRKEGITAGTYLSQDSLNVDTLCLPKDPEWGNNTYYSDVGTRLFGALYHTRTINYHRNSLFGHGVPCAVCLVHNRSLTKAFPARKTCYKGWRLEYQGYLMAGASYVCVDKHADKLPGGKTYRFEHYFNPVGAKCGVMKCPPYVGGREVMCAVCSK